MQGGGHFDLSRSAGHPIYLPPAVKKGAEYHHGDLRRALLAATLHLVDERGTEGFTLRAAARLAGVSDGAPYHHFSDKEALLATVAEEGYELLHDAMKEAAAKPRSSERERTQAMAVAYILFAATHPAHFRVMFSQLVHRRTEHPELAAAAARVFNYMRAAVRRGLNEREANLPPEFVLYGTWGLVHGLACLAVDKHLGRASRSRKQLENLAWGALRFLDAG